MALLGCYMRMPESAKAQCHARALATPRDAQLAAASSLYSVSLGVSVAFSLPAGVLYDALGPRAAATPAD